MFKLSFADLGTLSAVPMSTGQQLTQPVQYGGFGLMKAHDLAPEAGAPFLCCLGIGGPARQVAWVLPFDRPLQRLCNRRCAPTYPACVLMRWHALMPR